MQVAVRFHGKAVGLDCPDDLYDTIVFLFGDCVETKHPTGLRIGIRSAERQDFYDLTAFDLPTIRDVSKDHLHVVLMDLVIDGFSRQQTEGLLLHSGVVAHDGKAVLVAGASGAGKSSVVAKLVDCGFGYLTDELCAVSERSEISGFSRSMVLKPGSTDKVMQLEAFAGQPHLTAQGQWMVRPKPSSHVDAQAYPCRLIVMPKFVSGSDMHVEVLSPGSASIRLFEMVVGEIETERAISLVSRLSRGAPALVVQYGDIDQLSDTLDVIARVAMGSSADPSDLRRMLSLTGARSTPQPQQNTPTYEIPEPTPMRQVAPKLTIGMATYDDYDGVYFSLQALRLYHSEILEQVEFLVIDNHPDGPCAAALKSLEASIPNFRYVPFSEYSSTSVRNLVFSEASGEFVLCMDCHVFIVPGALAKLLEYIARNPLTSDLLQGPLLYDDLKSIATHFRPEWRGGMFGCWDKDERGADPDAPAFDIPMQGLGLFSCRREIWPGYNSAFRGFGGEEGYLHEKFRQNGGRTLCLPFLRWVHRFQRPMGVPYSNIWEDRIRNYVIGFSELGMPIDDLEDHFRQFIGVRAAPLIAQIKHEASLINKIG